VIRTPDSRFARLPGYSFAPHYVLLPDSEFGELRMHYVDEGPRDAPVVLLLHGQGCWAYYYREMIPLLNRAGYRTIAPDYIGFGRSDKLLSVDDYSFERHIGWNTAFLQAMKLERVTAFMFDWGGYFGLRIAAEHPEFFDRLVLSNTMLPIGMPQGREWFINWRAQQFALPRFPQGEMVNEGVISKLPPEVIAAYDAPYPDESYKTGPRRFPMILPIDPNDPSAIANRKAWDSLASWSKPVLTLFSERIGSGAMSPKRLLEHIPGAQGQAHELVPDASFYIVEDQGRLLAERIAGFATG